MNDLLKGGFDQILPLNSLGTEIIGFINVLNEEFYINLKIVKDSYPKKVSLQGSWRLMCLLQPIMKVLEQHLEQCSTIVDMLQELKSILEQQMKAKATSVTLVPDMGYYEILMQQLKECGWDRVYHINKSLDSFQLKAIDDSHRQHLLHIHLPKKFPDEAPRYECDIPGEFSFNWASNRTLLDLYNTFQEYLSMYCKFWNCLDEIDENTWVLEPERPTKKDCKRRIALAPTASLLIIVNPLAPSAVPVCHYLGPENIIRSIREKFNRNIDNWNERLTLLCNLKSVLDIDFPSPLTTAKEELCVECGICYAYQLGEALPDMSCNDPKCNQPFHHICLYEWLRSLPNARHSFNTVFGDCPYCSKPIWCTLP